MTTGAGQAGLSEDLRDRILSAPEVVLGDTELMRALIAANDRAMGENIVDLRGVALRRLEGQLDRLEDTHRSVIAAAYENLAGTNVVHRATLQLLEPLGFEAFLASLGTTLAATLRVESLRLVLESQHPGGGLPDRFGDVLCVVEPGFVADYMAAGRRGPARPAVLRQMLPQGERVHGARAGDIRSEAAMRLDFGPGTLPGMLVLGAEDPNQYRPAQGTDLLIFLAQAFERVMRRWLA